MCCSFMWLELAKPPTLQVALEVEAARRAAEAQARIEVEALQQRLRWGTAQEGCGRLGRQQQHRSHADHFACLQLHSTSTL